MSEVTAVQAAFYDHLTARMPADAPRRVVWEDCPLGLIAKVTVDQDSNREPLVVHVLLRPGASIQGAVEDVVVAAMRYMTPPRRQRSG